LAEREKLVGLVESHSRMAGVEVLTYAVMGNHFHLLVRVPDKGMAEAGLDEEGVLARLRHRYRGAEMAAHEEELARVRGSGSAEWLEAWRGKHLARMHDLSVFVKEVKQRFAQWYNRRQGRSGPIWEDRFKSVLLEGDPRLVVTVAAYIDLNPIRAGLVDDPKDYRHTGYAAALAGMPARRGAVAGMFAALGLVERSAEREALGVYRVVLFGRCGGAEPSAAASLAAGGGERRGIPVERVEAVLRAGGDLPAVEMLVHGVRYFTLGVALGSRAFVEDLFARRAREKLRVKRRAGARRPKGVDLGGLFTLRDLRPGRGVRPATARGTPG
jgi:hypothetical protein